MAIPPICCSKSDKPTLGLNSSLTGMCCFMLVLADHVVSWGGSGTQRNRKAQVIRFHTAPVIDCGVGCCLKPCTCMAVGFVCDCSPLLTNHKSQVPLILPDEIKSKVWLQMRILCMLPTPRCWFRLIFLISLILKYFTVNYHKSNMKVIKLSVFKHIPNSVFVVIYTNFPST